jgi:hypothetical protein
LKVLVTRKERLKIFYQAAVKFAERLRFSVNDS